MVDYVDPLIREMDVSEDLRRKLKKARATIKELRAARVIRPCGCRPFLSMKKCRTHGAGFRNPKRGR